MSTTTAQPAIGFIGLGGLGSGPPAKLFNNALKLGSASSNALTLIQQS